MELLYKVIKKITNQSRRCIITDHVVAESYANKRPMYGRRQFVVYLSESWVQTRYERSPLIGRPMREQTAPNKTWTQ
jgi:hypothetical protein